MPSLDCLSKKLATILLDVPVEFDAKSFELTAPDSEKVSAIFQDLEFRRLIDNFNKTFAVKPPESAPFRANRLRLLNPPQTPQLTREQDNFHCLVETNLQRLLQHKTTEEKRQLRSLTFTKMYREI